MLSKLVANTQVQDVVGQFIQVYRDYAFEHHLGNWEWVGVDISFGEGNTDWDSLSRVTVPIDEVSVMWRERYDGTQLVPLSIPSKHLPYNDLTNVLNSQFEAGYKFSGILLMNPKTRDFRLYGHVSMELSHVELAQGSAPVMA